MWHRQVELVVRRPGQPDRRLVLGKGVTQIGRAEDNDVVLPDIGVSRRHARIHISSGGVTVEDLGSGNGTVYRGRRINEATIEDGDEISIDPFMLAFHISAVPQSPEAEADGEDSLTDPNDLLSGIEPDAPARGRLVVLAGVRLQPHYPIVEGNLTIGRSDKRDVILYDPAASRLHVELRCRQGRVSLRDNNSANGTYVNGERITEQPLVHGDRIRIGATEFQFEDLALLPASAINLALPRPAPLDPQPGLPEDFLDSKTTALPAMPPVAQRPRPAPRPGRKSGGMRAATIGLAGAALLFALLGTGLLVVAASRAGVLTLPWDSSDAAPLATPPPLAPDVAAKLDLLLDAGKKSFDRGHYLEAASSYYEALQIAPKHEEAERMGYLACEYLALDVLRRAVVVNTTPEDQRRQALRDALALASRAEQGTGDLNEARDALRLALDFFPGDPKALAALAAIRARAEQRPGDQAP